MAIQTSKSNVRLTEGLAVECKAGNHKTFIDMPVVAGGTDAGSNPIETLLSALGACQIIIARQFASSMKVDIKDIRIELEGDTDPGGFKKPGEVRTGLQEIRSKIFIESDSPEEKVKEFVAFVESVCPVMDTMKNISKIESEIIHYG